jgi:hypothetical protein
MREENELPENVIAAIAGNRKIEAIKLLRREKNLGLKEAKEVVDAHIANNPQLVVSRPVSGGFNIVPLLLAAVVTAIAYFSYQALS